MSMVERSEERGSAGHPRKVSMLRMLAVGTASLILVNGAFNASFAQGPTDGYQEDISTAEAVAIGVGVAAGAAVAAGALGGGPLAGLFVGGRGGGCVEELMPNRDARILPPLPAGAEITELCLAPENTRVDAGVCRVFDLRAKSKADGRWYSVTARSETTLEVRDPDLARGAVVKLEGTKNSFCVPITAPQSANARSVVIIGTFAPAGVRPMTAEARILVRNPGRSVPPAAPPAR